MIDSRDVGELLPIMQERWGKFSLLMQQRAGVAVFPTSTYRDNEKQAALYAQGRTAPGKRVTNAKPGQSEHNHRRAVDFAFRTPKGVNPYEPFKRQGMHAQILACAKDAGLVSGGTFSGLGDWPHLELPRKDRP